jgi:hypothetical protein
LAASLRELRRDVRSDDEQGWLNVSWPESSQVAQYLKSINVVLDFDNESVCPLWTDDFDDGVGGTDSLRKLRLEGNDPRLQSGFSRQRL